MFKNLRFLSCFYDGIERNRRFFLLQAEAADNIKIHITGGCKGRGFEVRYRKCTYGTACFIIRVFEGVY